MTSLLLINLATILLRPTFNSCSVVLDKGDLSLDGMKVECRVEGGRWKEVKDFHGSLLGLEEDSSYDVRFTIKNKVIESGSFRTWKSDVPISKTIEIDADGLNGTVVISEKGTPDGWIRYTSKNGKPLVNTTKQPTFVIKNAEYVLLDDMVLRGPHNNRQVIDISNSKAIRIRNCDIAEWGSDYLKPDFSKINRKTIKKGNGCYFNASGDNNNWESAIFIKKGSSEIVVERCYIHDPLGRANSWYYSHPAGPQAIMMMSPDHSTVIRYNDFIAADGHNWNDAVESSSNFTTDGGFNRDADIYGNFMIFANDDCIELDGGQNNVRCFDNRFESALCGISLQGCMTGPSFVFNNLISGTGERFGLQGQTIKTGQATPGAKTFVWKNILWGHVWDGYGFWANKNLAAEVCDNKFCDNNVVRGFEASSQSTEKNNEFGVVIKEEDLPAGYPIRPLPFILDRARITVGMSREPVRVNISGAIPEGTRIIVPSAMPWLVPELEGNSIIIKFNDALMHDRREYRGAFLLRTPDGLSRPVSVYASSDFVPSSHPEGPSDAGDR